MTVGAAPEVSWASGALLLMVLISMGKITPLDPCMDFPLLTLKSCDVPSSRPTGWKDNPEAPVMFSE